MPTISALKPVLTNGTIASATTASRKVSKINTVRRSKRSEVLPSGHCINRPPIRPLDIKVAICGTLRPTPWPNTGVIEKKLLLTNPAAIAPVTPSGEIWAKAPSDNRVLGKGPAVTPGARASGIRASENSIEATVNRINELGAARLKSCWPSPMGT